MSARPIPFYAIASCHDAALAQSVKVGDMTEGLAARILVIPDVHLPYEDPRAWREAIYIAKSYRPTIMVQGGDLFDCHSVSSHDRSPDKHSRLREEVDESIVKLMPLLKAVGTHCELRVTMGNHEDRVRRYVWSKAEALHGMFSLTDPFGLEGLGFKVTQYRRMLKIGKVHFSHDIGGSGANAADKALSNVCGNVVSNHCHRAKLVFENNARYKPHFGMTPGWLGDPEQVIDYTDVHLAKTRWMHAVATIDMDKFGNGMPRIIPIWNR